MASPFITENEKKEIRRRCFENWIDNAHMDSLTPRIIGRGFTSSRQDEEIACTTTNHAKNSYFFLNILMKLSREKFHEFITILKDDQKHSLFAQEFGRILGVNVTLTRSTVTCTDAGDAPHGEDNIATPVQSAGKKTSNLKYIDCYRTKEEMSTSGKEKGIVFIIANITEELELGYLSDIAKITGFFKETLGYDVVTEIGQRKLKNLNKKDFIDTLNKIQMMVTLNGKYDRFYLFVLSHGDDAGILSHERENIPIQDIIRPFQHDNMPSMKDLPKLFFFQACRGQGFVQVAGGKGSKPMTQPWQMPSETIPAEADIMICYSVTESNFCFVKTTGSVFITEVMKAFSEYCDSTEDIGVIMREVKHKVSRLDLPFLADERDGKYQIVGEPGKKGTLMKTDNQEVVAIGDVFVEDETKVIKILARQMSTVTDNLTKKLLFKNPS